MERSKALSQQSVRRISLLIFAAALATYSFRVGIPVDRIRQTLWIIGGILVSGIGRPWRHSVRVFLDWIPFIALLSLYDQTRGVADSLGMPVHVTGPIDADRFLIGGAVPTVWLQDRLFDPQQEQWWDVAAALVYASHFVLPWLLAAVLYVRSRGEWAGYARRVILLSAAGLLTYVMFPAAPPWLAARQGEIDAEVVRISARGWSAIGMQGTRALFERAQGDVNLVAAVPSLHAAFSMLVALTLMGYVRSRLVRLLLLGYPLAMAFTLVYGGEHYLVDVLLGWAYVGLIMVLVGAAERLWRARHSRPIVSQAMYQPLGGLGLIRPDEDPQALRGVANGGVDALGGEGTADQIGVGVVAGPGDGDE